jgi:hypothetical protein
LKQNPLLKDVHDAKQLGKLIQIIERLAMSYLAATAIGETTPPQLQKVAESKYRTKV